MILSVKHNAAENSQNINILASKKQNKTKKTDVWAASSSFRTIRAWNRCIILLLTLAAGSLMMMEGDGGESLFEYSAWHESHRSRESEEEGIGRKESAGAKNGVSQKTFCMLCNHGNNSLKVPRSIVFLWQIQKATASHMADSKHQQWDSGRN